MKANIPTESEEQQALFQWAHYCRNEYPDLDLLYHVPNGGRRGKAEAGRFKAEGVKAGVPDVCLPVARGGYFGLYIEMKRREGGKLSDTQKHWQNKLKLQGYWAVVCCGWAEAAETLKYYLGMAPTRSVRE